MNTTNQDKPEATHSVAVKPTKSKGDKFFDRVVYGGIAGIGTFVATVPLTDWLKNGSGKGFYNGITRIVRDASKKISTHGISEKTAEKVAMTTALMMGGNVMLVPVGIAEHNKVPLVNGLNVMMGDKTPPELIEEAPKMTWASLIQARLSAWLMVWASLVGVSKVFPKSFDTFENEFGAVTCKTLNKPTHRLMADAQGVMQQAETKTYRYGKIAALDVFATAAAATLLYVAGHAFARKREEKIEQRAGAHGAKNSAQFDEAADIVTVSHDAPATTLEGVRSLEGRTQQLSPAASVQV